MPRVTFQNGAILPAAFLAGPFFALGLAAAQWTTDLAQPVAPQIADLSTAADWIVGAIIFAVPIGALFAIGPIMLGSYLLGQLGGHNPAFSLPVMWGLVGCLIPLLPLMVTGGLGVPEVGPLAGGLITACGGCALISRHGARWDC
ncbi:MAG: hypothetical protein ACRCS5_06730 [Sphingomonas sp.]|uniref:hypothetical protein n=1 Tax=Sphingomonas sp. TaxID=28214 RepID=UPI003F30B417